MLDLLKTGANAFLKLLPRLTAVYKRSRDPGVDHLRIAGSPLAVNFCFAKANVLPYFEPHLFVLNAKLFIDLRKFRAELAIDVCQIELVPLIVDSYHRKRNSRP